jgi:S1-C subfamily serine protease
MAPAGGPAAVVSDQRRRAVIGLLGLAALAVAAGPAAAAPGGDLPALIAAANASVLPVGTYSATGSPRFAFRGTGFVVGNGNLIATNFHVLADAAESESGPQMAVFIRHSASEGQVRTARVVATDRNRDLALLQIDGPPLPALALAEAGRVREGQGIALMGFPIAGAFGFATVTHRGIISSITTLALPAPTAGQLDARNIARLRQGNLEVLQLDATAFPGNSGGPVFDIDSGQVLGIVNSVFVKGTRESALSSPTGITYAIPVAMLRELLRSRAEAPAATASAPR